MGGTQSVHGKKPAHEYVWFDCRLIQPTLTFCYTGRPARNCPITGQHARYLDPRTGVPFASVHAFKTLTQILEHDFIWDKTLGCYTARADEAAAMAEAPVPPQQQEHDAAASSSISTRKRGAKQVSST